MRGKVYPYLHKGARCRILVFSFKAPHVVVIEFPTGGALETSPEALQVAPSRKRDALPLKALK